MNARTGQSAGNHQNSDMTFFDNKMLAGAQMPQSVNNMKRGMNSRSAQSRIYAGGVSVNSAGNVSTKAHSSASLHAQQQLQPQA